MNNYIIDTSILLVRNEAYMQLLTVDISEEGIANDSGTLLTILLKDRTTNKNIVWASPSYEGMGKSFCADQPIKKFLIIGPYDSIIQPRVEKNKRNQELRTRKRGEVFTPPWLVDKQVSIVLNEIGDISFESFIALRWLELACGEGPYIVTRYDSITGDIIPVEQRVGFLDRKLQRISEQSITEKEFIKWSKIAYESSYGYELQGDSLLLARENLLLSFCEHYNHKFGKLPTMKVIKQIATIISYNIFQMNGLTKQTPYSDDSKDNIQLNLFDEVNDQEQQGDMFTLVKDWKNKVLVSMGSISKGDEMMKFDVVIGNPPYQETLDVDKGNSSLAKQLFPDFIKNSIEISDKYVCLITPSRWFAGDAQDKSFLKLREYFRNNNHMKSIFNYMDAKKIFPNTEIKGGVNFFLFDKQYTGDVLFTNVEDKNYTSISRPLFEDGLDIIIPDINAYKILKKIIESKFTSLILITKGRNAFGIVGTPRILESITSKEFEDGLIEVRCKNNEIRWIKKNIISKNISLIDKFKVYVSKSAGNPNSDKKVIGTPYLGLKGSICTDSLIPIGEFDDEKEAIALKKYLSTKFLRYLVSIIKMSQNVTQIVYRFVPLQDFTPNSDIDWSQSIENIDQQLYKKYNLSQDEIDFIESKVRAMD